MYGKLLGAAAAVAMSSASAGAAVFASQDFNGLSSASTANTDQFPLGAVRAELTNAGSKNVGGPGLDFRTFWTETRGLAGPVADNEAGPDFIGVNSFSGSNAPDVAADGTPVGAGSEHNFEFNDGDGLVELIFQSVDISGFVNTMLSFDFWINDTGFEGTSGTGGPDIFAVLLDDISGETSLLTFNDQDLESFASADDGSANWSNLTASLSTFGPSVSLIIGVDNNAAAENVFVDNIVFSGDPAVVVPLPAGLPLMLGALGVLGLAARRRRG